VPAKGGPRALGHLPLGVVARLPRAPFGADHVPLQGLVHENTGAVKHRQRHVARGDEKVRPVVRPSAELPRDLEKKEKKKKSEDENQIKFMI
jgi:hypothetical protein